MIYKFRLVSTDRAATRIERLVNGADRGDASLRLNRAVVHIESAARPKILRNASGFPHCRPSRIRDHSFRRLIHRDPHRFGFSMA